MGGDPPPMREQVLEAIEGSGDAYIEATKVFLRHAVGCRREPMTCPVCVAILEACNA
jgi:hypothetical protein